MRAIVWVAGISEISSSSENDQCSTMDRFTYGTFRDLINKIGEPSSQQSFSRFLLPRQMLLSATQYTVSQQSQRRRETSLFSFRILETLRPTLVRACTSQNTWVAQNNNRSEVKATDQTVCEIPYHNGNHSQFRKFRNDGEPEKRYAIDENERNGKSIELKRERRLERHRIGWRWREWCWTKEYGDKAKLSQCIEHDPADETQTKRSNNGQEGKPTLSCQIQRANHTTEFRHATNSFYFQILLQDAKHPANRLEHGHDGKVLRNEDSSHQTTKTRNRNHNIGICNIIAQKEDSKDRLSSRRLLARHSESSTIIALRWVCWYNQSTVPCEIHQRRVVQAFCYITTSTTRVKELTRERDHTAL